MRLMSPSRPRHLFHGSCKEECTRSTFDAAPAVSITSDTYSSDVMLSPIVQLRSLFVVSQTDTKQTAGRMQIFQSAGGRLADAEPTSPQVGCMGQVKYPPVFQRCASIPSKPRPSADRRGKGGPLVNLKMMFSAMWPWKKSSGNGKTSCKKSRRKATAEEFDAKQTEGSAASSLMADQPVPSSGPVVLEGSDSSLWKRRSGNRTLKNIEVQRPSPLSILQTDPWTV